MDIFGTETKEFEGVFNELERNAVKCFGEVYLEHESGQVVFLGMLEHVKSVSGYFPYVPVWEVSLLPVLNQVIKYGF